LDASQNHANSCNGLGGAGLAFDRTPGIA
jgi:hypothetical protein